MPIRLLPVRRIAGSMPLARSVRTSGFLRRASCAALLSGALVGCASSIDGGGPLNWIKPYRIEVVQGNVVTAEMAANLAPGLTRDQVRSVLGSPLLADLFHNDRWDYVFIIRRQGATYQQRRVTVYFSDDRVSRFEADSLPSERDFVASIDVHKPDRKILPLELDEARLRTLPLPTAQAVAPAPAASGPQRTYPPLEPVSP
ncbi:MAG: outer membrane protein assembly factor BamE [Burkholderiales bacterium]